MKSTIYHDFPSPDLLEGPKDQEMKKKCKVFFSLGLQTTFTRLVQLATDHEVHIIYNQ